MKRFVLVVAAVLLFSGAGEARAQLGVAAGLNFESVSDITTDLGARAVYESASGYHLGVFFDIGGGPVALRLGAFYREMGEFDISVDALDATVDVSALDFPLDIRLSVLPTPVVRPYILGGPVLSVPRSTDDDYDDSLEDFSVAGNVGFGLEIRAGGLKLLPEFRYSVGLTNFLKDEFSVAGQDFAVSEDQPRSNTAMLRLGIAF